MGRPVVTTLIDELKAAATAAQGFMTKAEAENRELTAEERAEVDGKLTRARELRGQIQSLEAANAARREIDEMLTSGQVGTGAIVRRSDGADRLGLATLRKSLGQQFVESAAFEFMRAGKHRGGSQWSTEAVELEAATLTEDGASGGALVLPTQVGGIQPILFRRLTVADLLAQGTTDSNSIAYMEELVATNAAAPVAEGGLKPESALTFGTKLAAVKKIATWLPVSEEMLADAAQIRSYIDARLRMFVELAEEGQILMGDGIGPNTLGLRVTPGLAADVVRAAAETNADAIFRQIMAIFTASFLMPDGIVLNPADWSQIVLSKDTNGQYYGAGPFSPIQTPTLWGLPVAVTPAETVGVGFVGAFRMAAQLWRRTGIVVQASNSHADYFIRNLVAIRAERRQALTVYRPGAMGEVTGLGVPVIP
jgi:HK97 family phage major capsid protein